MIKLIASADGRFQCQTGDSSRLYKCAIGRSGMVVASQKREGDGFSPIGMWPLRRVFYRPDRTHRPKTYLPCREITPDMGWCDAPGDPLYNQLIARPYPASHEVLYREDHAYDVIVELGHNDRPPVGGLGSAIFLHVAKPGYTPTEGCIALEIKDLHTVLIDTDKQSSLEIKQIAIDRR